MRSGGAAQRFSPRVVRRLVAWWVTNVRQHGGDRRSSVRNPTLGRLSVEDQRRRIIRSSYEFHSLASAPTDCSPRGCPVSLARSRSAHCPAVALIARQCCGRYSFYLLPIGSKILKLMTSCNRPAACSLAKVEPRYERYAGTLPVEVYIISQNVHRRLNCRDGPPRSARFPCRSPR